MPCILVQADKSVVLAAVSQKGSALEHASAALKIDEAVMQTAADSGGWVRLAPGFRPSKPARRPGSPPPPILEDPGSRPGSKTGKRPGSR